MKDREGVSGAPGETRTPDPLLRRQTLYPAELRAHGATYFTINRLQQLPGLLRSENSVQSVQNYNSLANVN